MELSKKAIEFAEACRDGDIIEGTPVQLEMLARNFQVMIDEYESILMRHAEKANKVDEVMMRKDARIAELETELKTRNARILPAVIRPDFTIDEDEE